MSKLPKAVQQQASEADRLAAELAAPQPTDDQQNNEDQPPVDDAVDTGIPPDEGSAPDGAPIPAEDTGTPSSDETWEGRYKTLQGKYDAEIPRLAQANADLRAEVAYLKGKLETIDKQPDTAPSISNPKLEEFKKDYPDIYEYVQEMQKELGLPSSIEDKVKQLTEVTQKTAVDRFYEGLDSQVPKWRDINQDPAFAEWLKNEDRYTGLTKFELLSTAYNNLNVRLVANMFQDYQGNNEPAGKTSDSGTGKAVDKSKFVAPGTTKKSGEVDKTGSQPQKIYTKSEIDRYYRDVALNRTKYTPEQKAAKEEEFFKAIQENRVDVSR